MLEGLFLSGLFFLALALALCGVAISVTRLPGCLTPRRRWGEIADTSGVPDAPASIFTQGAGGVSPPGSDHAEALTTSFRPDAPARRWLRRAAF